MPRRNPPTRHVSRASWTCSQVEARKQMILHGEMTRMQAVGLAAHVQVCERCRHKIAQWRLADQSAS